MEKVQVTSAVNMTLVLNINQIKKKKKTENIWADPGFPHLPVAIFSSDKYNAVPLGGETNERHKGRDFICK